MAQIRRQPRAAMILATSPRIGRRHSRSMEQTMQPSNAKNPEIGTPQNAIRGDAPRSRARRWTIAGVAAATVATVATIGATLAWHGAARAHGPGMMFGGLHGTMDGTSDPEAMAKRVDAMVGWLLADVDATAEQRGKIAAIFKGAINDLAPMHSQHMQARKESLQLLTQPTIDRGQVEQLRVQQMQMGETASRRITQAILDAADVLTVAQRQQLVQKLQQRHHHGAGF